MKVECMKKTVDSDKIYWAIDCFKTSHKGECPSYIIMSYETKAELINRYYFTGIISSGKEERLFNIPIAFNNGLKFGEVDIV